MKVVGKGERIGRYALFDAIASGGMATVHFGRIIGPAGFSRTVAIKRLHPHLATDPNLVAMFLDEARLAARIIHPNVVSTLDVVTEANELFLVMDYVRGDSLSHLYRLAVASNVGIPPAVTSGIIVGAAHGLHAAHEAVDEHGHSLHIVHRDVSPQNVLVGLDGVPRIVDFGVAKAASRLQATKDGEVKGKLAYMAPEQLMRQPVDRRVDVWALGVVLWELLTGKRLFQADDPLAAVEMVLLGEVLPPSAHVSVSPEVDAVCVRALQKKPEDRFASAHDMAVALTAVLPPAPAADIGAWVRTLAGETIEKRANRLREIETTKLDGVDADGLPTIERMIAMAESPTVVPTTANSPAAPAPVVEKEEPVRRRGAVALGVAALVVLGLGAAGWVRWGRTDATPVDSTPPRNLVSATVSVPAVSASVAPPLQSAPLLASALPTQVHTTPTVRFHPPVNVPDAAAQPPPPKKNCDPPYTIDPVTQAHRFKPECL